MASFLAFRKETQSLLLQINYIPVKRNGQDKTRGILIFSGKNFFAPRCNLRRVWYNHGKDFLDNGWNRYEDFSGGKL
jgi:hypothetical protein